MNRTTRMITSILGVVLAISGMTHGFFEMLQGSTPTNGILIDAISESMQRWPHGSEAALTLIPNFLITGIAAIVVSIAIIIWSLRYLQTRHGVTVFLLLFILLTLVGGGIGHIFLFVPTWAFATRLNKPLDWWSKVLPKSRAFANLWPLTLTAVALLFLLALSISVFATVPDMAAADQLLNTIFAMLILGLICIVLSYISGFAHDIQQQGETAVSPTLSARRT